MTITTKLILIISITIVVSLFVARISKLGTGIKKGGFERNIVPPPVVAREIELRSDAWYIAGVSDSVVYLGNYRHPLELLAASITTPDTIGIKISSQQKPQQSQIFVDPPNFFISNFTENKFYKGTLDRLTANEYANVNSYFIDASFIGNQSIIIKTRQENKPDFVLAKLDKTNPTPRYVPGILEKQVDGFFCIDGMLHYSHELNMLVYLYYYRNQFMCMDSSLNLIYRGRTIDTTTHAKLSIAHIKSSGKTTLSSPPLIVNAKSCVSEDLFINSALMGSNERESDFLTSSVVDVYNLRNGKYRHSFYLPKINKQPVKDLGAHKKWLMAIYDDRMMIYQLK